jgi:hypothetical protein
MVVGKGDTQIMSTGADELDYPAEREMQVREESGRSRYAVDPRLFRPLPTKDKEKFDNKLFFLPFTFNTFAWFKNWPGLRNYYLTVFVHQINEVNDSGTPQRQFVICEPSMNKYATEKLSDTNRVVPPPFPGVNSCSFCKKSQGFWDKYREQKKAAGIEGLTDEKFKQTMDQHPEIRATKELAVEWGAAEKFYFLVFNYSRWLGETPCEADDDGACGIQAYIGPQKLVEGLYAKQKAKNRFWDFTGKSARAIIFTRDNKKGARRCEYAVEIEGEGPELDGETTAYLQNPPAEDLFDPAEFIRRLTVEEKKNYVTAYGAGSPTRNIEDVEPETSEAPQAEVRDTKPEPEPTPAAEVKTASPGARPRARIAAPSTPPPATAAPAAEAAPASAAPPPPPAQEPPTAPAAEAAAPPKRAKVTWRK